MSEEPRTTALRTARVAARIGPRAIAAGVGLALVAVPFLLLLLLVKASWAPLWAVDEGVRDGLHSYALAHPAFVAVLKALSFIGSTWVVFAAFAVVTAVLLWRRTVRLAVFTVVTVGGSVLLNNAVKLAVARARPSLPDPVAAAAGFSFPSGHAQAAIVTYLVLALLVVPHVAGVARAGVLAVAVVMTAGIGFSRIGLGVHYLTDVTAGYVLGGAWVAAMVALFGVSSRPV